MSLLISCQDLTKSFSTRPLFQGITFGVEEGEKIGIIGPNGSGKSTLIKILAGLEKPDRGAVSPRRGLRIGYVPQEDVLPEGSTVARVLEDALREEGLDEHERSLEVEIMLVRFKFPSGDQVVGTLSGGWKKRLSIARALIRKPELLMMDEPTNHLDLEAILWLEELLRDAQISLLLITHDRYFLQNVASRIIELNAVYAEGFLSVTGKYSDFLAEREAYLHSQAREQAALSNRLRREIEWLRRTPSARGTKAVGRIRQAHEMMGQLAELKQRNARVDQVAGVGFDSSRRQTKELLVAKGISKTLGGRTLFSNLDLVLTPRVKLGLLGANGSGKTTLLRLLTGELEPDQGEIVRADGLQVVLFDQNREQLDPNVSLREALAPSGGDTVVYQGKQYHIAAWAKRFLFPTNLLEMSIGYLSGGEQARILMARLMLRPADILILDEPTNDLDLPTQEILEESLEEFPGAIVLVTHDRYLLDNVSTDLLALDGKGHARYFADYAQWEAWRGEEIEAERRASAATASVRPAARVGLTSSERRELSRMEERIEAAEAELAQWQERMADPEVTADHVKLQECWAAVQAAELRISELYARWEALEAKKNGS